MPFWRHQISSLCRSMLSLFTNFGLKINLNLIKWYWITWFAQNHKRTLSNWEPKLPFSVFSSDFNVTLNIKVIQIRLFRMFLWLFFSYCPTTEKLILILLAWNIEIHQQPWNTSFWKKSVSFSFRLFVFSFGRNSAIFTRSLLVTLN